MSIRPAILALSIGLWGCAGSNTPLPTAPAETSPGSTGKLQSMDISTGARFKGALSKPAVFSTTSETTARNHGTNHAPTFNGSVGNQELTLLLPRGPSALLRFEGEPATDPDGDDVSYRFAFAVPGLTGIQTLSETLLHVTREGNSFAFHGNGEVTPGQFTPVYGEVAKIPTLLSAIYASDGNAESDPQVFNLHMVYDGSAQFSTPARYVADQRWEIPTPIELYEGTTSPVSDDLPTWTAVTDDYREWGSDWRPPLIRCEIGSAYFSYTLPDGGDDNALVSMSSQQRATSGTVSLALKDIPDFETPGDSNGDNQYRIRVVNRHNIHHLGGEGSPTGCSGSVLDLTIRVKDVGAPAPPEVVSARFRDEDDTTVDLEWATPGGFIENGAPVAFPAGFEVTDYDYRYRAAGSVAWTEVTDSDLTETAVTLENLTENAYEIQVRATNGEGTGAWSSTVGAERIKRTVSFGASRYATVEGDPSGVEVAVYLDPAAGALPITVPISVEEEGGAGPEDYSGVPSNLTFDPNEDMRTFKLMAMQDEDQNEGTEETIRLNFGDLPSNVTEATPASAQVVLEEPIPEIERLRIISTPASGSTYGRCEIIRIELVFDMPVEVTGRPFVNFRLDNPIWENAGYKSGSGTERLVFDYPVNRRDLDRNGISFRPNQVYRHKGTIKSLSGGGDANLDHAGLHDDPNHKVNGCLRDE